MVKHDVVMKFKAIIQLPIIYNLIQNLTKSKITRVMVSNFPIKVILIAYSKMKISMEKKKKTYSMKE